MKDKFDRKKLLKFLGKDISVLAEAHFSDVKYSRRNTTAARAVRDLGFSVARDGKIYAAPEKKDDFEILEDGNGNPYVKLKGLTQRGGKKGHTMLLFPSSYKKEFMASVRSWGKSGFNIFGIKPDDIEVTPSCVRIHLDYIEIVPDRKYLPQFLKWVKGLKLPVKRRR